MKYPSIAQYIDAFNSSNDFLRSLGRVELSHKADKEPIYCSGNFGVVFKVIKEGRLLAVKCFTRHQYGREMAYGRLSRSLPKSRYLVDVDYLKDEVLAAPMGSDSLLSYDVLVMDYVEGRTLTDVVYGAVQSGNFNVLSRLAEAFDEMALWLLGEDFAHGDIKPDNIMVTDDLELFLVDYDGAYLPEMSGEMQRECGTDTFQHPLRSTMAFDRHIDDYSLALISLSLSALAQEGELLGRFNGGNGELLIMPDDAVEGRSAALQYIEQMALAPYALVEAVRGASPRVDDLVGIISSKSHRSSSVLREGLRPFERGGVWGFVDGDRVVVEPRYERVQEFSMGRAAVCRGGKWGYVDGEGVELCQFKFDRAWDFTVEGLALVKRGGRYGFVGLDCRVVIAARYDYALSFSEGLAVAEVGGRYGYLNGRGGWEYGPQFDYAQSFRAGSASVEVGGRVFALGR